MKVEPPIIIADVPLALAFLAIAEAWEGVTFSGSIRVIWMDPSELILSSKYFSTAPIKALTILL
jgi:hypothetical protein